MSLDFELQLQLPNVNEQNKNSRFALNYNEYLLPNVFR